MPNTEFQAVVIKIVSGFETRVAGIMRMSTGRQKYGKNNLSAIRNSINGIKKLTTWNQQQKSASAIWKTR